MALLRWQWRYSDDSGVAQMAHYGNDKKSVLIICEIQNETSKKINKTENSLSVGPQYNTTLKGKSLNK